MKLYILANNGEYSEDFDIELSVSLFQAGFPYDTFDQIKTNPLIVDLDDDSDGMKDEDEIMLWPSRFGSNSTNPWDHDDMGFGEAQDYSKMMIKKSQDVFKSTRAGDMGKAKKAVKDMEEIVTQIKRVLGI